MTRLEFDEPLIERFRTALVCSSKMLALDAEDYRSRGDEKSKRIAALIDGQFELNKILLGQLDDEIARCKAARVTA